MRAVVYGCLYEFVVGKYSRKFCVYKLRSVKVKYVRCHTHRVVRIRD